MSCLKVDMLTLTDLLVVAVYGASPRREAEIAILDLQNWIYKIRLLKGDDSRNDNYLTKTEFSLSNSTTHHSTG